MFRCARRRREMDVMKASVLVVVVGALQSHSAQAQSIVRECTAERQGAEHVHPCNTNYEYSTSSPECALIDGNSAGCVSVPTCAAGVTVEDLAPGQPNGQKICMQYGASVASLGFVPGQCLMSGASVQEGCYLSSTPRRCDRSPVVGAAHGAGHDLGGTSAGAISDETQATPRKFNGANDYVQVSQNKLGTYCDVTIDTWIKFGPDAFSKEALCSQLGPGWTLTTGSPAYECPGTTDVEGPEYCVNRARPAQCRNMPQMNHPIMSEDNWDEGDLHYQIYDGVFGFDINGNGDYAFQWQPGLGPMDMRPDQWYYITAIYSCADHRYHLHVSTPALAEPPVGGDHSDYNDQNALQTVTQEEYRPEGFCGVGAAVGSCTEQAARAKWPMISFENTRIGAWFREDSSATTFNSQIERALDGEIYEFKVFSYQKHQCHHCTYCYGAGTPGMELSYTFSNDLDPHVPDLSGNGRDGVAHCDSTESTHCIGGARPEHVTCTNPGFGGYFDGEADYVRLPELTRKGEPSSAVYVDIQVDVWAKFHCITGDHPIMNNDGWSTGDLHYQIYNSEFGFDINGNGDYTFSWLPPADEWVYISVFYSSEQHMYKLWAQSGEGTSLAKEEYDPDLDPEPATKGWVPVVLDSPRLGGWVDDGQVQRSMDGQISVFRVWSAEQGGEDSCPCQHAQDLEAFYVFGESNKVLRDLSGNRHDGTIVGGKFGDDEPLSECVKELRNMAKNSRLTEHCMEEEGMVPTAISTILPVFVLLCGIAYGVQRYLNQRVPGGGKGGDGLSQSIFEMDAGIGGGGAAAPYVPPEATTSTSGGGTIYD